MSGSGSGQKSTYSKRSERSNHYLKRNKRLRKETKCGIPWKDEWELEQVGKTLMTALGSDNQEFTGMSFYQALDMVAVWKARCAELPHAIESTAAIAQVYWRDFSSGVRISASELRLAYSSAIVRCINGFADTLQQQRFVAAPVSVLCGQLGIPTWLVDVRHEAAHNAMPSLEVLRLAASALLEFLRNEYWIPTCLQWTSESAAGQSDPNQSEAGEEPPQTQQTAIDYLLEYKARTVSPSIWEEVKTVEARVTTTTMTMTTTSTKVRKGKSNKSNSNSAVFDMFFGDDSDSGSSSDDNDDSEDPLVGNIWGSAVGTSINRFALLADPGKPKKAPKKKKPKPKKVRKAGEKSPLEYAKHFVKHVSPQEGFSTALAFLVWGGIGGAPEGRGVLIPGSVVAFPATQQGINKAWKRYSPLIQVLGCAWPRFCSTLLVHLVDFVLAVEDSAIETSTSLDAGSARKLFFLSSWIRLLLSVQFVAKVDPELRKSMESSKNGVELELAPVTHLAKLEYPLNSLCDRISEASTDNKPNLRKTSQDVLCSLERILGQARIANYGIKGLEPSSPHLDDATDMHPTVHYTTEEIPEPVFGPCLPPDVGNDSDSADHSHQEQLVDPPETGGDVSSLPEDGKQETKGDDKQSAETETAKMSLEAMEALLSEDDGASGSEKQGNDMLAGENGEELPGGEQGGNVPSSVSLEHGSEESEEEPGGGESDLPAVSESQKRPAWIRCETWDPCTIGTLPGRPV